MYIILIIVGLALASGYFVGYYHCYRNSVEDRYMFRSWLYDLYEKINPDWFKFNTRLYNWVFWTVKVYPSQNEIQKILDTGAVFRTRVDYCKKYIDLGLEKAANELNVTRARLTSVLARVKWEYDKTT